MFSMTTAFARTVSLQGVEALPVDVQVQVRPGLASFQIVGLPDNAVREARERVQAAFHSAGLALPAKRVTVNLSPADLPKQGGHYDLPIAAALLVAVGALPSDATANALFMGELSLGGNIAPITGALPGAIYASRADLTNIYVPPENTAEATWAGEHLNVYGVPDLRALVSHLKGEGVLSVSKHSHTKQEKQIFPDFSDVKGQNAARRAAEIAAAGGHHMLMTGPPGSGKSMIAKRLPGLLPAMTTREALDVSLVHSVAGMLPAEGLIHQRPYREPHHSASSVALTGGGHHARPGEISLAHGGVLFLDELPEFPRQVLETLRQPLEGGEITVARANHHLKYPAQFQLVAAMNPCPCGYKGHHSKPCTDTPKQVQKYQARLSGPLLDRFDLFVDVQAMPISELSAAPAGDSTATMAARVEAARQRQRDRFANQEIENGGPENIGAKNIGQATCNARMEGALLETHCQPDSAGKTLLDKAAEKYSFSARSYHRVLKVARTIADLDGAEKPTKNHVAEALSFRQIAG